jgi:hypothetical protein
MRRILLFPFFIIFISTAFGQQKDAQLWASIYIQKPVIKKVILHLEHQSFFVNNITSYGQGYFDLGVTYKFNKHFRVLADYVHILKRQQDFHVSTRYRYYVAFIAKQSFGRFSLVYRNRIQNQYVEPFTSENKFHNNYYDRNKLSVRYEVNKFIETYLSAEAYTPLAGDGLYIDKMRYATGVTYNLTGKQQLEGYFLLQKEEPGKRGPLIDYVFGIGYNIGLD